ncbi:MAG: hypothetical protein KBB53_08330 [Steroidobacteraceae bacterium]|nr:hypothetical protein [Steroidobacteraceae bacterium]MBP7013822.1 hypothetical protein [Steroidobacteraceae bacterium]
MGVVLVEVGPVGIFRQAVEVREQVADGAGLLRGTGLRATTQVVDQRLGVDLLLDVQRRRVDDEVGPVLLVLAAPHELRIEVAVAAPVGHLDRTLGVLVEHRLVLGGGDVLARGFVVLEGFDGQRGSGFVGFTGHCDDLGYSSQIGVRHRSDHQPCHAPAADLYLQSESEPGPLVGSRTSPARRKAGFSFVRSSWPHHDPRRAAAQRIDLQHPRGSQFVPDVRAKRPLR